jgi:hypothetical protein
VLAADDRGALMTAGAQCRDGRPADLTGAAVSNTLESGQLFSRLSSSSMMLLSTVNI